MANLQSFFQTFAMIIMLVNSSTSSRYFELDTSWPNESIQRLPLHGTAVVLDADNNLIYLTRGSNFNYNPGPNPIPDAVLVVIDRETGNVTRQWGENMFFHPHGLEIAINGDIFVTDSHLHQVFKVFIATISMLIVIVIVIRWCIIVATKPSSIFNKSVFLITHFSLHMILVPNYGTIHQL